jgi:hypothetical protein
MKHLRTCLQLKNERIQKETVVFTELANYYSNEKKKNNKFWRLGAKRNKSRRNGPTGHKKIRM